MNFILSALVEVGRSWFDDWRAAREDARKVKAAAAENRARLLLDQQTHNNEWEMRALEGADKWLRRLSFAIWSGPMVWAVFDPAGVDHFFRVSLAALPDWYVGGYLAMTGAIWGIVELKARGVLK